MGGQKKNEEEEKEKGEMKRSYGRDRDRRRGRVKEIEGQTDSEIVNKISINFTFIAYHFSKRF